MTKLELSSGDTPIRVMLVGGEPLNEDIVMWWNFVGRPHEEIALWREGYKSEMRFDAAPEDSPLAGHELGGPIAGPLLDKLMPSTYLEGTNFPQYGQFPPNEPAPLPAPALPTV